MVRLNLNVDGRAERVMGAVVTANFFEGLGVQPHIGRGFVASAETPERTGQTRATGRLRLRHAFVIGQVALSAFLLVLSALLVRTAARAAALDPGFDLGSGAVAKMSLDRGRSDESRRLLAEQLTERLLLLPDVQSVSVASIVPLAGELPGRPRDASRSDGRAPAAVRRSTLIRPRIDPPAVQRRSD
jgi:hypothetical protein